MNCCGIFKAVKSCLVCCDTKSHNCFWVAVGLKTIRRGWSAGLLWSTLIMAEVKRETRVKEHRTNQDLWHASSSMECHRSLNVYIITAVSSQNSSDKCRSSWWSSLGWNSVSCCWMQRMMSSLTVIRHLKLQKSFFLQLYHRQFHHYTITRTLLTTCDDQVADIVNRMIFSFMCRPS